MLIISAFFLYVCLVWLLLAPAVQIDEKLKVIYIKSYKVASTTTATIFQRISEEQGLKAANRYNSGMPTHERMRGMFQLVYGHNFYDMGSPAGWPCTVKQVDGKWTFCGGYQSWMDFYIEDAHHLIMVASPLSRMSSMYYYEAGYTKQRDRGPEDTDYKRISEEARFTDPANLDRPHIAKFLSKSEYYTKWERVQWWWIRDMTANRTVEEAIKLLDQKFVVGLSHRYDEALLIWKAKLGLTTRDILYTRMKASLTHPKVQEWAPEEQKMAEELVESTGDKQYFEAATAQFERQVDDYGRVKLESDVTKFKVLLKRLTSLCAAHAVMTEQLHVPDQVYCFLKHYDVAYELALPSTKPVGCFSSLITDTGRFAQKAFSVAEMTLSTCVRRCMKEKDKYDGHFKYAGLAHGTHCYCGMEPPDPKSKESDDKCNVPCTGNKKVNCGGYDFYWMHKVIVREDGWIDPIISADALPTPK